MTNDLLSLHFSKGCYCSTKSMIYKKKKEIKVYNFISLVLYKKEGPAVRNVLCPRENLECNFSIGGSTEFSTFIRVFVSFSSHLWAWLLSHQFRYRTVS